MLKITDASPFPAAIAVGAFAARQTAGKVTKPIKAIEKGKDAVKSAYHYTNEKGLKGILDSGKLKPSLKANNPKDARAGDGQYLSDIAPGKLSNTQLAQKFIKVPNKYKYTHFLKLDLRGLNVKRIRDGVLYLKNGKALDLKGRIKGFGKNKKR